MPATKVDLWVKLKVNEEVISRARSPGSPRDLRDDVELRILHAVEGDDSEGTSLRKTGSMRRRAIRYEEFA